METIFFGDAAASSGAKPPLLFLHGSYCGAWVWERHFLPFFAEAGFHGAAISLRAHGKSPGRPVDLHGISDYLKDIEAGANLFDTPPALIGHSLGGYLAQKYALRRPVAALVLLASPSLHGLWPAGWHIASKNPRLAFELWRLMMLGPRSVNPEVIAAALFSRDMPVFDMLRMLPLLQRESFRVSIEASFPDFSWPPRSLPPTLVVGSADDAFVPPDDLKRASSFWRGRLHLVDGLPHGAMMDSTSWPRAARPIKAWLEDLSG
ncbi:MAG: alpha/beta fold hydrolase [Xanthobacteraceae bacterium]